MIPDPYPHARSARRRLLQVRGNLIDQYSDVLTLDVMNALAVMAPFDLERKQLMAIRALNRLRRAQRRERLAFRDPSVVIEGTNLTIGDARSGGFAGGSIPPDLQRQWVQGTGPAARPRSHIESSLRNVAYGLLSGADGWMFDGEDALGGVDTMSLENQRSLKLAIARSPLFMGIAEQVASHMNAWSREFLGDATIRDWKSQLDFTATIFRPRGFHLDDRHVRWNDGTGFSASIVDTVLYLVNNHARFTAQGRSLVLYLPKIQTCEEASLWNDILLALEGHLGLLPGTVKVYVLIEQLEASFQLMEIRAALARRFVGFNTGRWDYINSVSDAMAWDETFVNPNIDAITMTYGYMRSYEDRVRRAANTPDLLGQCVLWQGGMEAQIPVGSHAGVQAAMARAISGAEREQREGASGKWVAHWKMVPIIRPVWERAGQHNQLGRVFPPLTYTMVDAADLLRLESGPRTVCGARDLVSVALQYANASARGYQAAALKPADYFDDDDVLYLMEDLATGEIRCSILWEWLHKGATFTENDSATGTTASDCFTVELFLRLLDEEYVKLLRASARDVFEDSKQTTLPIARETIKTYVMEPAKAPWLIDLLNINLNNLDIQEAKRRVRLVIDGLRQQDRLTENIDFDPS